MIEMKKIKISRNKHVILEEAVLAYKTKAKELFGDFTTSTNPQEVMLPCQKQKTL